MKETTANRGMDLEKKISNLCDIYIKEGRAVITKIPTDWKVIRKDSNIVSAFPKEKSIVDYLGCVNGVPLAIETKRVTNSKSFPLSNIKNHQFVFFKDWCQHGNGYYIIYFKYKDKLNNDKCYLVDAKKVDYYKSSNNRKSIPLNWFEDHNNAVLLSDNLDFLPHIV